MTKKHDPALLLERAVACGEWMVRNQIQDRFDANRGRGIRSYDADTGELVLTGNWMTGSFLNGLLALWKRTGDERYFRSAEFAGRYLLSLQVMDKDDPHFGAIREITPQSIEFAPRDATSGAWGLVWLAEATGQDIYLRGARLFGDWLVQKGMYCGWPLYAIYMDPAKDNFYSRGSFQSGAGLFLHDLFMVTGDAKYIERGLLPIARIYRDDFITDSGRLNLERDPFTGEVTSPKDEKSRFEHQHSLNDDYGGEMMIAASRLFGDDSYIHKTALFAMWLASVQDNDGGFAGGHHPSAAPVAGMLCRDIGTILNEPVLLEAGDRSLGKIIATQFLDTGDPKLDGAFKGRYEGSRPEAGGRRCVNMRTTAYSLMALLKAESDLSDIWLGLHNRPFRDHRWLGGHDLVW